jgi:hypothetical protein
MHGRLDGHTLRSQKALMDADFFGIEVLRTLLLPGV